MFVFTNITSFIYYGSLLFYSSVDIFMCSVLLTHLTCVVELGLSASSAFALKRPLVAVGRCHAARHNRLRVGVFLGLVWPSHCDLAHKRVHNFFSF